MIEVKNLVKRYGGHLALDHLSFTVSEGQIYGFLGPNGAGKTTTMNIMTGYLGATEGEVLINGHNILEEPEEAKKYIGYLPELPPLYLDMTVMEYLRFAAELKGIRKQERGSSVNEVMDICRLHDVHARLIKNLSKGYRQRVGLAQAILGFPEIIILDEPMVGLDPKQIIEIRDLIKDLAQKHTVILSSHILSEISAICDHIMIISHGRLVASDTPDQLEKLLDNTGRLSFTVKAGEETVRLVLEQNLSISEYDMEPSADSGAMDVTLDIAADSDLRERIFFGFADVKCPVIMMKVTGASLEDVFLELTSDAQESEEEAANTGADIREAENKDEENMEEKKEV